MKPRTVAQLKKLIAEGLKKSPDGIARLDVSDDELSEVWRTLDQYYAKGFDVEIASAPEEATNESSIRDAFKKGHAYWKKHTKSRSRIAIFPRNWKGLPLPLSEQLFTADGKMGAQTFFAHAAINRAIAQWPDAIIETKVEDINDGKEMGYFVRAWNPMDYLTKEFPAYKLNEIIVALMKQRGKMFNLIGEPILRGQNGANKTKRNGEMNHKKIREMFLALRQTPGWTPTECPGKTALLCQIKNTIKPKVCESTIIKACRGLK